MGARRVWGRAGLGAVAAAGALLLSAPAATPASTATPYCGIRWGSLPKVSGSGYSLGTIDDVRSGRHGCYDRLVIDIDSPRRAVSYDVRYVGSVHEDGSGRVVPLRGGADVQIVVRTPAYDEDYGPTYEPANRRELVNTSGYSTFRQVAWAGSFEGQTTIGLGTRARLPMRVFVLDGPGDDARLVIDVAHRW
ncbi:hypothetical protein [Janibacter anophelis]|uniref:AMIN-like domain-containing (lipo)protein n=1 Tax=Janibacter anophelis TaxID=319054 RepID=UPI000834E867|nr:hypothetical protein [Janibacter anophelis]